MSIRHTKIKPLEVAAGVRINSQEEIVLSRLVLDDTVKIGWLEGTVKNNLGVGVEGGIHSLERSVVQASFIEVVGPQSFLNAK